MRTMEQLMNVEFDEMTAEEKKLAVSYIAERASTPVYDMKVEDGKLVAKYDAKASKEDVEELKKLFDLNV